MLFESFRFVVVAVYVCVGEEEVVGIFVVGDFCKRESNSEEKEY